MKGDDISVYAMMIYIGANKEHLFYGKDDHS